MNLINRKKNTISYEEDLQIIHTLEKFPVFMGCVQHGPEDDLKADMTWSISPNNGILQLYNLIPQEILYQAQHDSGQIGKIWMDHHREFAEFIEYESPESVLEIGGAHGILSREYHSRVKDTDWIIIEPNPIPFKDVKAKYIQGFFDDKFKIDTKIDTVVHSHVFEHVYDPNQFIKNISNLISEGDKLIFSLPNMKEMLKSNFTNCINFEHTIFLTEEYVQNILSKHGFELKAKKYFLENHSIFYTYIKSKNTKITKLPENLYEQNKKLYLDYINFHDQLIKELNIKIKKLTAERNLYLFGAHIFSQYLISSGLNTDKIRCLLDNDENKHNKRLYGTNKSVFSPNIIKNDKDPIIILKAGVYNDEIKNDILDNINSSSIFWE